MGCQVKAELSFMYGSGPVQTSEYSIAQEAVRMCRARPAVHVARSEGRPRRCRTRAAPPSLWPRVLQSVCVRIDTSSDLLHGPRSHAPLDLQVSRVASTPPRRSSSARTHARPTRIDSFPRSQPTPRDREKDGATSTQARLGVARPLGCDCSVRRPVGQHHRGRRRIRSQVSRPVSPECLPPLYTAG